MSDLVICGAGIAGISTAYWLAVKHGLGQVVLVDERSPLSLTSDKSTECYRNWWPGPDGAMVQLMNRSIDLLEDLADESGNIFHLNRRGYVYSTGDPARIPDFRLAAEQAATFGAGPVRYHTGAAGEPAYCPALPAGFASQPTGADLITDPGLIHEHFPYLTDHTVAVLHARRCGWFSAQQLGMYLLQRAREHGVQRVEGRVSQVETRNGRVQAVHVATRSGSVRWATRHFLIAAGPYLTSVARLLGLDLPVYSELHLKLAFTDSLGVIPRHAPLLIWADSQFLPWSEEERAFLASSDETRWLLAEFPAGVHTRPEGSGASPIVLMLWAYHPEPVPAVFPPALDDLYYPEVVLRGLATMLPGLRTYFGRAPKPILDGGYYTKTRENRPLIGPLPVPGAYVLGALSGFGLMVAPAAGELLAAHLTGSSLPPYAPAFALERYQDPQYQALLENWGSTGQL